MDGWQVELSRLRNAGGMHWEVDTDPAIAALVAGQAGGATVGSALAVLADSIGRPLGDVTAAALPVVQDLLRRGLLDQATTIGDL